MLTCTVVLWHPLDFQPFPLTGPGVCQEWLAVAVFMDRTFTHVCHTGPAEQSPKTNKKRLFCPRFGVLYFPVTWHSMPQQLVLNGKKVKGIPAATSQGLIPFLVRYFNAEKPPEHQGIIQKHGVEKTQEISGREDWDHNGGRQIPFLQWFFVNIR